MMLPNRASPNTTRIKPAMMVAICNNPCDDSGINSLFWFYSRCNGKRHG
ncbi:Uncharacterised protein [Vibrio cholerae]|nr:Uncharacterised protein [Vibrio cholerae]